VSNVSKCIKGYHDFVFSYGDEPLRTGVLPKSDVEERHSIKAVTTVNKHILLGKNRRYILT
jgi:hypothetical protein